MKVEYKDGIMIVIHSTGQVDTYTKSDCQKWLAAARLRLTEAQASVKEIENTIKVIDNSVRPKLLTRIRSKTKCTFRRIFG